MSPQQRAPIIRIVLVHSFYSSRTPSGENIVVEAELAALRRAGHDAFLVPARTDELEGARSYPVRSALRVATGRGNNPMREIRAIDPEVVHVHNLFPNWGRAWVRELTVPLVHTLHNYRPLCANAMLLRDGAVCTLCPDGARWAGVRHRCYRESRIATIPLSWANRNGPDVDPVLQRADRLLVLSERQRAVYAAAGVPAAKLSLGFNFLPDAIDPGSSMAISRNQWLFVGRLSEEKGIVELLRHWPQHEPLTIVGDGPLRSDVEAHAARVGARLTGALPRSEVLDLMRTAWGLVFPSIWYEAAPIVYLEALATGLPVVAFEPNVVADFVRQDGTGVVSERSADGLVMALAEVKDRWQGLRGRCRSTFDDRYSEAAYRKRVADLYGSLIRGALTADTHLTSAPQVADEAD